MGENSVASAAVAKVTNYCILIMGIMAADAWAEAQ
jgi:hypothetical protein